MNGGKKNPKIVISGYYGFDNCGDEAVLLSIIHCLKELRPDVRITVLSGNPEKTCELYGVEAANRWSPLSIAREILTSDLLISGGGSLLQDVTSVKSPLYYLGVIKIARFFRKKVMIYSQGIGPLLSKKNRASVKRTLKRCHVLTVRDDRSAEFLRELGVDRDIHVACDPVMALSREDVEANAILEELGIRNAEFGIEGEDNDRKDKRPLLVAAIRNWKDDSHIAPAAELLDSQVGKGWDILVIPAHFPGDLDAVNKLRDRMTTNPYCIDRCLTAREFLALTAVADRVFSMRLHGLICAMAVGTPMLGLSYDPKVDAFMEQAGLSGYCLSSDDFDLSLAKSLMDRLDKLSPDFLREQETRRSEMKKLAWETAEQAVSLLPVP